MGLKGDFLTMIFVFYSPGRQTKNDKFENKKTKKSKKKDAKHDNQTDDSTTPGGWRCVTKNPKEKIFL
jgi:hypothetical protein